MAFYNFKWGKYTSLYEKGIKEAQNKPMDYLCYDCCKMVLVFMGQLSSPTGAPDEDNV